MTQLEWRIHEVLPEGDHQLWATLSDGHTRLLDLRPLYCLPSYQALRLHALARQPALTLDGQHVVWPNGALLDITSIRKAPTGPLPVQIDALISQSRRYRPVLPVLKALDPAVHHYLDVRPVDSLLLRLGLKKTDWTFLLDRCRTVPPELLHARLSDLTLLLSSLIPDLLLPGLLRQTWPYALHRCPKHPTLHTADGCLRFGRFDLLEVPLTALLLAPGRPLIGPGDTAGPVIDSQRETAQRSSTSDGCEGKRASEQRGR